MEESRINLIDTPDKLVPGIDTFVGVENVQDLMLIVQNASDIDFDLIAFDEGIEIESAFQNENFMRRLSDSKKFFIRGNYISTYQARKTPWKSALWISPLSTPVSSPSLEEKEKGTNEEKKE